MIKNRKLLIAIITTLCFVLLLIKVLFLNNVNLLFLIAEGQNKPSNLYHFFLYRIYRIAEKKDIGEELIQNINTGKNEFLFCQYIRVLGVIGEIDAIPYLIKIYTYYQGKNSGVAKSMKDFVIRSLGRIGDEQVVPFLEAILNKQQTYWLNSVIASSLYLLTGERYEFDYSQGESYKFVATKDLMQARQVILNSKGKKRTYEDMIVLDKSY